MEMHIPMIMRVVVFNIFGHLFQFQDLNIVAIFSVVIMNQFWELWIQCNIFSSFWLRFVIGMTHI